MVCAPVGGHDQICKQSGRKWLHQDVGLPAIARAARRVANHPAGGIATSDRDEVLAGLKHDVGDQPGRGIDLEDRALAERIDLRPADEPGSCRLDRGVACCRTDGLER